MPKSMPLPPKEPTDPLGTHLSKLIARAALACVAAAVAAPFVLIGCGTLGPIASPTPVVIVPSPTPTPTLADRAKSDIVVRFDAQQDALNSGDFESAFNMCAPDYRAQTDLEGFTKAVNDYLSRFNVTPQTLDARNLRVSKGTAERYDISYDIFINGEFSETVSNAGGYIIHNGSWFDDHAMCR